MRSAGPGHAPILTGIRPHLEAVTAILGEALAREADQTYVDRTLLVRLSYARGVMSMTLDALKDPDEPAKP